MINHIYVAGVDGYNIPNSQRELIKFSRFILGYYIPKRDATKSYLNVTLCPL